MIRTIAVSIVLIASACGAKSPPAKLDALVHRRSDSGFDVDAKVLSAIADDRAMASVRIVPLLKAGSQVGYKLYAIRPGSLFARLGLLNGDTVTAIDGTPLDTHDRGVTAVAKLTSATAGSSIEVSIERAGAPITITYAIR